MARVRWDEVYFGGLGGVVALVGVLQFVAGVTGSQHTLGPVTLAGTFLLWRGVVLSSAGAFYIHAATGGLDDRRAQAIVFMGSLMVWIVAGTDLFARVLGTIPGGPDVWVASVSEIVGALLPPYGPAVVLAPFSLVALGYAVGQSTEGGTG